IEFLERLRRLDDDAAEFVDQRQIERLTDISGRAFIGFEPDTFELRDEKAARIEELRDELASDLEQTFIERRVDSQLRTGRPITDRISGILLEQMFRGNDIPLRLAHLFALG